MNLHTAVNETASELVTRYQTDIENWLKLHDASLANIIAIARNLEKQAEIKDLRSDTVNLGDIAKSVVTLSLKRSLIDKSEAKQLRKLIASFELQSDTIVLRRKYRSMPKDVRLITAL